VVKMLLKYGVERRSQDAARQTPLMVAAANGQFAAVRKLIDKAQLTDVDQKGRSLIYHAYRGGNMSLIKYLKHKGVPGNTVPRNQSSLFMAAVQSPNLTLVQRMADSHDVNETNLSGETPLFLAALNGRKDVVTFLMARGARVIPEETDNGQTLLIAAARLGDVAFLRQVIVMGVNVNHADNEGRTALFHAVSGADVDSTNLLLTYGADPNLVNRQGVSPVELAVRHQNPALVQSLLKADAIPAGSKANGESLLMIATRLGNEQIVGELLGAGASIHAVSADGTTLLMVASQAGMTDFVRLLLQWGQPPSATNQAGKSALDMARTYNHGVVVSILEARMAGTP
jgi:ankyrin repeat protein